jgi:hypothetical protein
VLIATVGMEFFVATILRSLPPPGTFPTFGVQFLSAVTLAVLAARSKRLLTDDRTARPSEPTTFMVEHVSNSDLAALVGLLFAVGIAAVCALLAARIARRKYGGIAEAVVLGAALGPIGVVIVAVLPSWVKRTAPPPEEDAHRR